MTPEPADSPAEELLALCDRLCDGTSSPEERIRLEALVLGDADLRRLYVERMHLHAHLWQSSARLSEAPLPTVMRHVTPARTSGPRRIAYLRRWQAAAAALFVIVGAWWLSSARSDPLAHLEEARNARWGSSTLPTEPGSPLSAGRLSLMEGLARLRFRDGAEVTIEGPAELELISGQLCRLQSGSLVAHVPPPARGFTVLTKDATLIDHGTDFGISADRDGRTSVQVMKGEVELRHNQGGPSLRLLTQQMAAITPEGLQPAMALTGEPGTQRMAAREAEFTQELTTASGRGAAAFVASPGTDRHSSDTLLLLKNAPNRTFQRKAILRFDLSSIRSAQTVQAAQLTLQFEATGYGYAALGGDATFVVYAVTDDAQDDWSPDSLAWATMPAFSDNAGRVDETKAIKVGEFTMPRGVLRGPMSISGPALVERIRNDANRLLTLIVVRENPLEQASGVVHGFAGNHHPTLPPPTLRLR
jgi:ferric-dicitrate binding protein FerR (iron transport regulator)